jgi:hypothetical protein
VGRDLFLLALPRHVHAAERAVGAASGGFRRRAGRPARLDQRRRRARYPACAPALRRRVRADSERWLFLTGDPAGIARLAQESFRVSVLLAPRSTPGGPAPVLGHSPGLVLVDRVGRIRGYYHSEEPADVDRLRQDVALAREERSG